MYLLREMQTRLCEPARPGIAGLRQPHLIMPNRKGIAVSEAKVNDTHGGRRLPKRNRRLLRRASHDPAQTCRPFVGSLYNKSRKRAGERVSVTARGRAVYLVEPARMTESCFVDPASDPRLPLRVLSSEKCVYGFVLRTPLTP